ncbi:MAG: hypothetical protein IKM73_00715 [Acidaminococcaceae bacterium]|nr:hypothetical protein [Acidaminococcaceae bacterium]
MAKYINLNTERAQSAMAAGNMVLASRLFEICYMIAEAITAGETEETARGKYLITIADMIASGKEL